MIWGYMVFKIKYIMLLELKLNYIIKKLYIYVNLKEVDSYLELFC